MLWLIFTWFSFLPPRHLGINVLTFCIFLKHPVQTGTKWCNEKSLLCRTAVKKLSWSISTSFTATQISGGHMNRPASISNKTSDESCQNGCMTISLLYDYFHRCCVSPATSNASRLALMVQRRANRLKSLRALVTKRWAAFTVFFTPPLASPDRPLLIFLSRLQSAELQTWSPNPRVTPRWKSRSDGRQLNRKELHDVTPETQASGKGGCRVFWVWFFCRFPQRPWPLWPCQQRKRKITSFEFNSCCNLPPLWSLFKLLFFLIS